MRAAGPELTGRHPATSSWCAAPPQVGPPQDGGLTFVQVGEDVCEGLQGGPPLPGFASLREASWWPQPEQRSGPKRLELGRHLPPPEQEEASDKVRLELGQHLPLPGQEKDDLQACQDRLQAEGEWGEQLEACPEQFLAAWMPLGCDGHLQLCLRRSSASAGSPLLRDAEELVARLVGCDPDMVVDEDLGPSYVDSLLQGCHPEWEGQSFGRAVSSSGVFAGMAAVGTGEDLHERRRMARLALALATVVEYPQHFGELFLSHHCSVAFFGLLAEVQVAPVLPVPSGDAADGTEGYMGMGLPPERLQEDPHYSIAILQSMARSSRMSQPPPETLDASDPRLQGVPEVCLNDPFMELRVWDEINGPAWWPHCTLCNCWSDVDHLRTKKHVRLAQRAGVNLMPEGMVSGFGQASLLPQGDNPHEGHGGAVGSGANPDVSASLSYGASDEEVATAPRRLPRAVLQQAMRKEHLSERRALHRAERRRHREEMAANSGFPSKRAPPAPSALDVFDWSYHAVDCDWVEVDAYAGTTVEI